MFDATEHQAKVDEEIYWLKQRNLNWQMAWANVLHGISSKPKAIVTYASKKECNSVDPGASIERFYNDCRAGKCGAGVWVGD